MKVMTVVGTRPEIIRLSRVISLLDETVDHVLVHTGQNYDPRLSQVFFEDLSLRPPDVYCGIDTSTLGRALGGVLIHGEDVLRMHKPDAVLVLGDTNSCLVAVIARRMHIPVYHMEAGNRSYDENVPEEVNRRLVDHVADFNLVYTEHARRNLLQEGLHPQRIFLTGSPLREVFSHYMPRIEASDVLARLGLVTKDYVLVSIHREEHVDDAQRLRSLVAQLDQLAAKLDKRVIVSTHPRTKKRLERFGVHASEQVLWEEAFGFLDYAQLQLNAYCVVSDSGSISEEAGILGIPAVHWRACTERPEGLEAGVMILSSPMDDDLVMAVEMAGRRARPMHLPFEYLVEDVSDRVVRLILGTCRLRDRWLGVDAAVKLAARGRDDATG